MQPAATPPLFGVAGSRPNVLFVLVDDWGRALWPEGDDSVAALLPNITREFHTRGLSLRFHYAHAVCAPSRKALLTGRFSAGNSPCLGAPLGVSTVADRLREAGYQTHFVGKWHIGFASRGAEPRRRGFDSSVGYHSQSIDHYLWHVHKRDHTKGGAARVTMRDLIWNDSDVTADHPILRAAAAYDQAVADMPRSLQEAALKSPPLYALYSRAARGDVDAAEALRRVDAVEGLGAYSQDVFTRELLRVLWSVRVEAPFFAMLSAPAVHGPEASRHIHRLRAYARRDANYSRCDWNEPWLNAATLGCSRRAQSNRWASESMAVAVDDTIGEALSVLHARRLYERTLLVFASDNGGVIGRVGNEPLRGGKSSNLEGGVRVRAAVGGGYLPAALQGKSSRAVSHFVDWWPTLAELAGLDPTLDPKEHGASYPVDGVSMAAGWRRLLDGHDDILTGTAERLIKHEEGAITLVKPDAVYKAYGVAQSPCTGNEFDGCPWDVRSTYYRPNPVCNHSTDDGRYPCALVGCTYDAPCVFDVLSDPMEKTRLEMVSVERATALRLSLLLRVNSSTWASLQWRTPDPWSYPSATDVLVDALNGTSQYLEDCFDSGAGQDSTEFQATVDYLVDTLHTSVLSPFRMPRSQLDTAAAAESFELDEDHLNSSDEEL